MPQLDTLIFFNQFFWFFSSFFFIYCIFGYVIVPELNFYYFIKHNIIETFLELESNFDFLSVNNTLFKQNKSEISLFNFFVVNKIYLTNTVYFSNYSKVTNDFTDSIFNINTKILVLFLLNNK